MADGSVIAEATPAEPPHSRQRSAHHADERSSTVWTVALIACALAVALQIGAAPLSDPDLPSHLALGEWIVRHRAVPFVEPFAWTRPGAPFFAYSWLAQVPFFLLLRATGPVGLHLLAAVTGAAIVVASAAAGRALGLRHSLSVVFGIASAFIALEATPFLRPQLFLHVIAPLCWMYVARFRNDEFATWTPPIALFVLNALAANLHITFPAMAAPLAPLFLLDDRARRTRRAWLVAAAVLLGWLCSPYALSWFEVFRLNFAANAITKPPAPTGELTPGFVASPIAGVLIAALPLFALSVLRSERERLLYGAMWLAGLVLFARIFKGLGPWWWCSIPLAVAALGRLPRASADGTRRIYAVLLTAFLLAQAIPNVRLLAALGSLEGGADTRTLPAIKGYAAEPAARWLERNARPGASGRVLTVFNYGSYLGWRLPALSMSVDGRTIFPDSAALPDAIGERGVAYLGPYRSADLAVVPLTYPVAARLNADPAWTRVGVASAAPWAPNAPRAALWVRRDWWSHARASNAVMPSEDRLP